MAGEVKVLLVSAGASPEALTAELRRLGVKVIECSFADAEEAIETDPPDLVALAGALGAVELANIIDDLDEGPRMVIVAERKELAKLRGLNREVVVSLFAMETTEKVVGQRIESLARRAARRNEQNAAPGGPEVKKTALGLPSGVAAAAAVGRVNLKRPPGAGRSPVVESVPPSSGNHPGAEPPTPEPPAAQAPPPPRRDPGAKASSGEPEVKKDEDAPDSVHVMDEDLLESLAPDAPEDPTIGVGAIPTLSTIPLISAAPEPDEASVSHPPTLPPEAKAQSSRVPDVALAAPPGALDISDAESALENLDSVKLDLTEDIVAHAKKGLGEDKAPAPPQADETPSKDALGDDALLSLGPETIPPEAALADDEDDEAGDDVAAPALGLQNTLPLEGTPFKATPPKAEPQGAEGDTSEPASPSPVAQAKALAADVPQPSVSTETPSNSTQTTKKGGGSGKALAVLAALVAAGVAATALNLGGTGAKDKKPSPASAQTNTKAPQPAPEADEQEAPETDAPQAPAGQASPGEEGPGVDEGAAPAQAAPAPEGESPSGEPLENPFKVPDTNKPSCDSLLKDAMPTPGKDPVSEASQIWSDAREAIVAGKLDDAHLLMCQAVALFPESAAIEGLAAHYLAEGSLAQALLWVDKADAVRPGQREMGNLRGDIYAMMGDIEKARDTWLKTLNIAPEESSRIEPVSKDYSVEAGRHLRRGDLVRAELFFRRAVILDADNLNGIMGLAKVYHRLDKPQYARAFCEMSLKVTDVIPEVHVLLGEIALSEGNNEEAKERFERALAVRPGFFPAKRGLAQVK